MHPNQAIAAVRVDEARVNVTHQGQNGDLAEPVPFDATDAEVRRWVTEAVRGGDVPGLRADANADFTDFVVDRFAPVAGVREHSLIALRPKTPFGQDDYWNAAIAKRQRRAERNIKNAKREAAGKQRAADLAVLYHQRIHAGPIRQVSPNGHVTWEYAPLLNLYL